MLKLIITTWPNNHSYEQFIEKILNYRFAACVNVISKAESFFYFNNEYHHEKESLLYIKTSKNRLSELITFLEKEHPYDCPEILILDIETTDKYKAWVYKHCK